MSTTKHNNSSLSQTYNKIEQTLSRREAAVHHSMYYRYQEALTRRELVNNKWFACHITTIADETGYSKRQVKRATRKLWRKNWLKIMDLEGYQTHLYQWLDDSVASILELVSYPSKKVYLAIQREYTYQNGFHNYVLDGWFEYSIKQVAASSGLFQVETNFSIKELKRKGLLEQKNIGIVNYFRLPKR